jgi:hypothetical protein
MSGRFGRFAKDKTVLDENMPSSNTVRHFSLFAITETQSRPRIQLHPHSHASLLVPALQLRRADIRSAIVLSNENKPQKIRMVSYKSPMLFHSEQLSRFSPL